MTRYIDDILDARRRGDPAPSPSRPIVVVGPSRPGALPRLLGGWGIPADSVAWVGTPAGAVSRASVAVVAAAVAHAARVYGCSEIWCLVESDDLALTEGLIGDRIALGIESTPRATVEAAVALLSVDAALASSLTVVGVLSEGDRLTLVSAPTTVDEGATWRAPSIGSGIFDRGAAPPLEFTATSASPTREAWGASGGDAWGASIGGDAWEAPEGTSVTAGGAAWGPVGGDGWGDPPAAGMESPPSAPVTSTRAGASRPRPGGPADLSNIPPAIVDAARTLRRFVDQDVPKGVLLRVMKSRVKTAGDVRTGLKDLCTLVKEYGGGQPPVMDAYRMVDHALPRVREKQAHQVLTAIFGVG